MTTSPPYRVLARKYRPQRFSELIGQDAMVTTLGNAIKRDRLAHAFLLTGVRGVGKTSTARLIAKALNCVGPDGTGGPTIDPCGVCEPCVAIAEGRHVDVIEIDAASNNGVDNIREMTDAVRYAAVTARYKLYIIDEVHMLSKPAFNALLKTLEEPPPHVKFLLATTEVDKVPVTVLSRCQRFDLRRIASDVLAAHFAAISASEGIAAEPQALTLIARAAEGSVRDGLSILDQAIAHADMDGDGSVTGEAVRAMLGLSDRGAIRTLFERLLAGDAPAALAQLSAQVDLGVDPAGVLRALLEIVHATTVAKAGGAPDPSQSAEEREAFAGWSEALSFGVLHRLWQLLLKGHDEVARAVEPHEAADMALLRLIYASSLPDPAALVQRLESGDLPVAALPAPVPQQGPASFAELVDRVEAAGKHVIAHRLRDEVGVIAFAPPELVIRPHRPFDLRELTGVLREVTGTLWQVRCEDGDATPSLHAQQMARDAADRDAVLNDPAYIAMLKHFPDAELLPLPRSA